MLKFHYLVGNDLGNSEQDIYVNGKLIRQPNVFATAGQIPWIDDETDVPKNLKNIYDNIVVSIVSAGIPTGMYHIGAHALKTHGENVTNLYVKGNNSKADQLVPFINTLGTIAARAVEEASEMGEIPDQIDVIVDMGTALPVKQHTPKSIKTMQERFMQCVHQITIHLGKTKQVTVSMKFEYVHVLQEGTPVVFALQMDSEENWRTSTYEKVEDNQNQEGLFTQFAIDYKLGDIDGSYFEGKNILHGDLGDGTFDTPFTRGDAVDKDYCDGVNHGVGHAIDPAISDLISMAPYAYNSISRQQFSEILKSEFEGKKDKFLDEAKRAFAPHFSNQINQINKHISDQILRIGANNIDILTIYGGGSILSKEVLYDVLKELTDNVRIQLFYVPAKYAVTLNAEGLNYFVRSEIYSFHKKNYISQISVAKATVAKGSKHTAKEELVGQE